ncbi:hypothetical protein ODJ79_25260 [Actinoplanes sp. KI2]|uniref:hypothetical protein n=1 Tax=Actinoplanes sp. KI2 TaxID=2983315 RepID=UPI0021D5A7E9|nr:hypothetical protein [Actinoplanes sp. KI2]MCU7727050.1 hypothetical protein [Actinoplanes sp. KI2]
MGTETFVGSAWRMSSRWTASIWLTAAAAVGWLAWRMARGRVPVAIWLAALAAIAVSVLLTLQQRSDVETWPPAEVTAPRESELQASAVAMVSATEFAESLMPRDHLRRYTDPGIEAGPSYGFWVGLAGMTLTGLSLVVAGRGGRYSIDLLRRHGRTGDSGRGPDP